MEKIEYRVRPVTRFIVTRYACEDVSHSTGGVSTLGEFANRGMANVVAAALATQERSAPRPSVKAGLEDDASVVTYQLMDADGVEGDLVTL